MEAIIGAEYPDKVIPLIEKAGQNIDIVSYDWRWYANKPGHSAQQINIALVNAARRGVQVRAILNVAELVPLLNSVGIKARTLRDKRTLHAKMILIDGAQAVIGSHNLTANAFYRNLEVSVIVEIPEGNDRLRIFFENLYNI